MSECLTTEGIQGNGRKEGRQFRILKRDRPSKNVLDEAGRDR